jgi:type II/III secretion system protein
VTVESVNGQTRVVPKNTTIATGLNVTLLPLLSADRHFVSLSFHADHTYPASAVTPLIPVTTQITPRVEGGFTGKPVPFTHYIQQPKFNTLTCDSHLVIADGGTMLIDAGKLDRNVRCASEVSVPVLARIPYLNRLFKTVSYEPVTEHMLVMVTARVIYPVSECNNKTPASHCKSQGGCGATATCQSGCCTAGCCDKGCCTSGSCSNGCCKAGCEKGCCQNGCCEKDCCQNGCCSKCGGKPAKVAVFAEEASAAPAKPAKVIPPAATKSPVELRAEKMAAKLVQKYHEACANGEPEKARRYGRQALDLDPECFGKTMIQESYQRMPQPPEVKAAGLIDQSDYFGPVKRPEWKPNEFSDRPSHLTPERVHGGIR